MKRTILAVLSAVIGLALGAAIASAQPPPFTTTRAGATVTAFNGDPTGSCTVGRFFINTSTNHVFACISRAWVDAESTTLDGANEWTGSNTFVTARVQSLSVGLNADNTVQVGQIVKREATANGNIPFTQNGASETLAIGVYQGTEAAVFNTTVFYDVVVAGMVRTAIAEDVPVDRGHVIYQSATAGYGNDNVALQTNTNVGVAMESANVTSTIDPTGCGGGGCVDTTTDTITLDQNFNPNVAAVGDPVIYWNSGGTSIGGLTDGFVYFIKTFSGLEVTLSASFGGPTVDLTSQGNDATQYLQRLPLVMINIR